jgi:FNIP Repeat
MLEPKNNLSDPINSSATSVIDEDLILRMGKDFNEPIEHLLNGLKGIEMNYNFAQPTSFPDSLKYLKMENKYHFDLVLPRNLETLILGSQCNVELSQLPTSLKKLEIGDEYMFPVKLHEGLEHFEASSCGYWNHPLDVPSSLCRLILENNAFDYPLVLPKGLVELQLGNYSHSLQLPDTLKILKVRSLSHRLFLPCSLEVLKVGSLLDSATVDRVGGLDSLKTWLGRSGEDHEDDDEDYDWWYSDEAISCDW